MKTLNMKKIVRLTESDLHKIIKKSVNKVLKEEKPVFLDSEIATRGHTLGALTRLNEILEKFDNELKMWIINEGYSESVDKFLLSKVNHSIRQVLDTYGLPRE